MSYYKRCVDSFNLLKSNLILLVPGLIYTGIFLLLVLILLKTSGLLDIIVNNLDNQETLINEIKNIFTNTPTLINFLVYLIIFIITNFIIGVTVLATKLDMIKSMLKNKKPNLRESFSASRSYFLNIIAVKFLIYLTILIPITIIILLQILLENRILTIALIILALLFYLYLIFSLYFIYQVIFLKTKQPMQALKESFSYFLNNKKHTIFTFLIVLFLSFIISYLISPIQQLFSLTSGNLLIILMVIFYIISILVNQSLDIWKNIFNFLNYLKK